MSDIVRSANNTATKSDRYTYESVLGKGSFGTVLKACDMTKNEPVAVKLIRVQNRTTVEALLFFVITPAAVEQGRREVNLLNDLSQHNNVIAIRDHFEFWQTLTTPGLAIVMEYCPGGNLQAHLEKLIAQGRRTTLTGRLSWFKQLAAALEFIHQKGIAHRDLKPENILIDGEGKLKVADVGIAKALYNCNIEEEAQEPYEIYMTTVAGTLPYMAPEVFERHYTISSDVFSMGLVMFVICELPTSPSRPPKLIPLACYGGYNNENLGILLYKLQVGNLKSTSLLNARHCPSDELELFNSILQYHYNDRPTAKVVVQKLKDIEIKRNQIQTESSRRQREQEAQARWPCRLS